ncbi:hypothetical protein HPP92_014123, partial [Vanilla planifolia]
STKGGREDASRGRGRGSTTTSGAVVRGGATGRGGQARIYSITQQDAPHSTD